MTEKKGKGKKEEQAKIRNTQDKNNFDSYDTPCREFTTGFEAGDTREV